jgi:integrase
LVLDPRLYPALEAWLFDAGVDDAADAEDGVGQSVGQKVRTTSDGYGVAGYRAALRPKHRRVFSRPNGEPWDVSELSRAFSRAAVRLTGKKTNPHLVRDMVITHVRGEGIASDAELEALSLYMGHSIAMQKGTYDRRTSAQKVAPAIGLMSAINARAAGGVGGGWGGEKKR